MIICLSIQQIVNVYESIPLLFLQKICFIILHYGRRAAPTKFFIYKIKNGTARLPYKAELCQCKILFVNEHEMTTPAQYRLVYLIGIFPDIEIRVGGAWVFTDMTAPNTRGRVVQEKTIAY